MEEGCKTPYPSSNLGRASTISPLEEARQRTLKVLLDIGLRRIEASAAAGCVALELLHAGLLIASGSGVAPAWSDTKSTQAPEVSGGR